MGGFLQWYYRRDERHLEHVVITEKLEAKMSMEKKKRGYTRKWLHGIEERFQHRRSTWYEIACGGRTRQPTLRGMGYSKKKMKVLRFTKLWRSTECIIV